MQFTKIIVHFAYYLRRNISQSGGGGYICVQFTKIIVLLSKGATRNDSDAILRASDPKQ